MLSRAILRSTRQVTPMVVCSRGSSQGARDEVNFPRPKRLIEPGKVRMAFIPDEWFLAFHKKTGVTGPYFFGLGLMNYLLSKEWYVLDHEYYTGLSLLAMIIFTHKKFGPTIAAYLDKECDKYETDINQGRADERQTYTDGIQSEKEEQIRANGNILLMEAKKENVLLQLEAAYRERIFNTYIEVKRRLDFQMEKSNVERRLAQKHMCNWIVSNVLKSITPEQEKETLNRCIADLGALAAKQ